MQDLMERLRWVRMEKGMTQKEVAQRMNVPQDNVSKLELGTVNATLGKIVRYANAVGKRLKIDLEDA